MQEFKRETKIKAKGTILRQLLLMVALVVLVTACSSGSRKGKELKLGVIGAKHELWDLVQENLKKEGIDLKLVEFNDYNTPNEALAAGDLDLNAFQHHQFFDTYNKERGNQLVAIGDTFLSPIGLYSKKHSKVAEIPEGGVIAIPNDPTNFGRALNVLAHAKLIEVKADVDLLTLEDITANPKNLTIKALDAAQTARALEDVDGAVVNTDLAVDAGLDPQTAIIREPVSEKSKPYFNLVAVRAGDENREELKKVVKAYQSQAVADLMAKIYGEAQVPAWDK